MNTIRTDNIKYAHALRKAGLNDIADHIEQQDIHVANALLLAKEALKLNHVPESFKRMARHISGVGA